MKLAGVLRKAGDRFLRPYGLTLCQFNILMVLRHGAPSGCSQTELCRRLLVQGANMTGLVRRLQSRGLLLREDDPGDERAWKVKLSGKGRDLLRRVELVYYRRIDRILSVHTEKELERFSTQLQATQEALARHA